MQYCARCLYPSNHPLNIAFDEDGVCSGCRVHEEKDRLDWSARFEKLKKLADAYRSTSTANYDCIVPVTGARDSYFIVHTVKHVLGLRPLLVSYNRHHNTRLGIRNLAYLRTVFDCDFIQQVVQPQTVKRINRETLHRLGSIYWHVLAGQTAFPVQVSVRLRIPLIIWGVHQGCDQVGMFSHTDEVEMTGKYRKEHDLLGVEAHDLVGKLEKLKEADVAPYAYPDDADISRVGTRGIYLSNYIPWDTKNQHEQMLNIYNYETAYQQRTFDTYNDVDCVHYSGVHDYIKFLKFGYSKVVDHASREIRWGRLTREEGLHLVKAYQNVWPGDIGALLKFNEISRYDFFREINRFRDPQVWERKTDGEYEMKICVLNDCGGPRLDNVRLTKRADCAFRPPSPSIATELMDEYVLLDRGWIDDSSDEMNCAL